MIHDQFIPILDFGAQYAQLIARRVREAGVFSELVRPDISIDELKKLNPKGLILSGGPSSVYEPGAPKCDPKIFDLGVPVLGICYGMQLGVQILAGLVDDFQIVGQGPRFQRRQHEGRRYGGRRHGRSRIDRTAMPRLGRFRA